MCGAFRLRRRAPGHGSNREDAACGARVDGYLDPALFGESDEQPVAVAVVATRRADVLPGEALREPAGAGAVRAVRLARVTAQLTRMLLGRLSCSSLLWILGAAPCRHDRSGDGASSEESHT
jgi:hypothetical protein